MRGELVSLDERRQGAQQRRAEEELRAKVPARYQSSLDEEDWLVDLTARVRAALVFDLTPEEIVTIAIVVAGFLERRAR